MAVCNLTTLEQSACANGFTCLSPGSKRAQTIRLQLLCELLNSGGAAGESGYAMTLAGGWESGALTDATTYFTGGDLYNSTRTGVTTYANMRVRVPKAGTITKVYLKVRIGTAGTAETVQNFIRINNATDVGQIDLAYNAVTVDGFNTTVNQAVAEGDYIALKSVGPTWVTNPVGVRWYCVVYIET